MSFYLCLASFAGCYLAARRSLVSGLVAVFSVGYAYGIIRANLPETYSHFIFDAGVLGLYAAQLFRTLSQTQEARIAPLRGWLEFLIVWPLLLFLIPIQDILIQFVGLRGNIFLLPFLLLGARMEQDDKYKLALWFAVLNLAAFMVAGSEFVLGIEKFFPHNKMTELIYLSRDVVGHNTYRIPASFVNAHAYGGTMGATLPLIIGALVQKNKNSWHKSLLMAGFGVAIVGVLMSAARTPFVVAAILIVVATFSLRSRMGYVLGWFILLCGIGWVASGEARLQRFMELGDTDMVAERLSWSVNMSFVEAAAKYPFGNGLGGGGTSIPYFLQDRIRDPVLMENEYARIMLEQGLLGLMVWVAFIVWVLTRQNYNRSDPWYLGRRLAWVMCAVTFAYAVLGTGLLTSVPHSCLILLMTGWVAARQTEAEQTLPALIEIKATN
ncbi:MAG TPA: hypothetical protein VK619_10805 [Pyrinomonadaceae bacterium]|nr:hypothetical protein [Pyrinomonadaceae bacterium]